MNGVFTQSVVRDDKYLQLSIRAYARNLSQHRNRTAPPPKIEHATSSYNSIGSRQYIGGNRETDLIGCLEIDDEFKLRGLLHRQVSRFGAFQDFVYVVSRSAEQVIVVHPVEH